ncbi:MAG: LD-carboxypeptidase, partial [Acidobacteria bacterium]|nr:LD-carboxypeptidase [Acidobacteriota bacterium]
MKELERLGYKASYSDDLFAAEKYFAGSHERRIQEFQRALADPNTKAVFAARGGYGSGYLTGKLTKGNLQPKIVLGASDLTVVHLHLLKHFGWVTFYGPMVAQEFSRGPEAYDETSLRASLEGRANWVAYE